MAKRTFWTVLATAVLFSLPVTATSSEMSRVHLQRTNKRADRIVTGAVRLVNFAPLEDEDVEMACESTQAPKALATPHPSWAGIPDNRKIIVNVIIGMDGQVYSPFILDGAGPAFDQKIMDTVRSWHYLPAMCNGVPADSEVKIQLSSR